jgi:hypothetical protein
LTQSTTDLVVAYRETALAWDAAQGNSKKANPLFRKLHAIFKELRRDPAGRDGISALMNDPNIGVRLIAAGHSLLWAPEAAQVVLEEIEKIHGTRGLYAVDARYTLKAFREGTLNLDW